MCSQYVFNVLFIGFYMFLIGFYMFFAGGRRRGSSKRDGRHLRRGAGAARGGISAP